ncbi:MAG: hypothetical protein R3300_07295 [Candidatus Promineifilaceae bacterium]|nr:hypothetical protein [Candidatus Promineifilaceae bacterium]
MNAVLKGRRRLLLLALVIVIGIAGWLLWRAASGDASTPERQAFRQTFDSPANWTVGEAANGEAQIEDGRYVMTVELSGDIFWGSAGRTLADGVYEVEAVALEGTIDNGYGLLLRIDHDNDRFYMFKISSDGFVYIGLCRDNCLEVEALVNRDWFASEAVNQGLDATNRLRVVAAGAQLTFFVNDSEVGQVVDNTLAQGDVGLMAETFTPGGLRVAFDNFEYTPLQSN